MIMNLIIIMSKTSFFKPDIDSDARDGFDPIEELIDPIRSKILFETLLKGRTTAEMLEKSTKRSKSTVSHHLKKLVIAGLLDVSIGTSKTKYYQLSERAQQRGFAYKFDQEAFSKATEENQAEFIIDLFKVSSVLGHVHANLFSDQVEFLRSKIPFDSVMLDEDNRINFKIDGIKSKMPTQLSTIVPEEALKFISKRINELIEEIDEKFGSVVERINDPTINPKYLVNLQIFPYFNEE
jgi:DNA-binding transcriptional ArsR family regulator